MVWLAYSFVQESQKGGENTQAGAGFFVRYQEFEALPAICQNSHFVPSGAGKFFDPQSGLALGFEKQHHVGPNDF